MKFHWIQIMIQKKTAGFSTIPINFTGKPHLWFQWVSGGFFWILSKKVQFIRLCPSRKALHFFPRGIMYSIQCKSNSYSLFKSPMYQMKIFDSRQFCYEVVIIKHAYREVDGTFRADRIKILISESLLIFIFGSVTWSYMSVRQLSSNDCFVKMEFWHVVYVNMGTSLNDACTFILWWNILI